MRILLSVRTESTLFLLPILSPCLPSLCGTCSALFRGKALPAQVGQRLCELVRHAWPLYAHIDNSQGLLAYGRQRSTEGRAKSALLTTQHGRATARVQPSESRGCIASISPTGQPVSNLAADTTSLRRRARPCNELPRSPHPRPPDPLPGGDPRVRGSTGSPEVASIGSGTPSRPALPRS